MYGVEKMYVCKKCGEQITDEEFKFSENKKYFPDGCDHPEVCGCISVNNECCCDFKKG